MEHHPLADLFPQMSRTDYTALLDSIRSHGLLEPITLLDGKILDGTNRDRACEELRITPRTVDFTGPDPLAFVLAKNLTRRHLDESQRAMVAGKIANMGVGGDGSNQHKSNSANLQTDSVSQSSAAKLLHVGTRTVSDAKTVLTLGTADLIRAVEAGNIAVSVAKDLASLPAKEQIAIVHESDPQLLKRKITAGRAQGRACAKEKKVATKATQNLTLESQANKKTSQKSFSVADWKTLSATDRAEIIAAGFASTEGKMNRQTNDSIEWAGYSLNVVTGCLEGCPYCYARDLAERYTPSGFIPTFHPSRLSGPRRTVLDDEDRISPSMKNIFANSMSDLFGKWVPPDWIQANIDMARNNPKWNFLVLTKSPERAVGYEFPDNWWMGTTVDTQDRVKVAEDAFEKINCKTKWLSVEPLLSPLTFSRLGLFQWVVIGGASASSKTPEWVPPFGWLARLYCQIKDAGCKVYFKANTKVGDRVRVREFPWEKMQSIRPPKEFR